MTATPPTSADIELHPNPELTLDRRTQLQTTWNSLIEEITQGDLTANALTTGLQLMEETAYPRRSTGPGRTRRSISQRRVKYHSARRETETPNARQGNA